MFFSKIQSIHANELQTMLDMKENIQLIDVREKDEFRSGHIKEAKNVPLSKIEDNNLKGKVYVICQSGMRSKQACRYLAKQGCDVVNVLAGMNAWRGKVV